MDSKPSFWQFLKAISKRRGDGQNIEIYDKKNRVLTEYEDNSNSGFGWWILLLLLPIFTFSLQITYILRPLRLMPNLVFELIILELLIISIIILFGIYLFVYRKFTFKVVEKRNVSTRKETTAVAVLVGLLAAIMVFCILNSYTVLYIKSLNDEEINNSNNILLFADWSEQGGIAEKDNIITSEDVADKHMQIDLYVFITLLPVKAYFNDEEVEANLNIFETSNEYAKHYFRLFWRDFHLHRCFVVDIPEDMYKEDNTFKIVFGDLEKIWTIDIEDGNIVAEVIN